MRQRVITGILFTLGVCAFFIPAYWLPVIALIFSLLVSGFVIFELIKALRDGTFSPSLLLVLIGTVIAFALFIICYAFSLQLAVALSFYLLVIGSYCVACGIIVPIFRKHDDFALQNGLISAGIVFYVTFPLYCFCCTIMLIENGWFYGIIGLFAPWVSDVFAYFSGVTLGKHKIIEHISPKKTWEGCIGGALGCAIAVMLYSIIVIYRLDGMTINPVLFCVITFITGFVISVMSQLGDWFASVIKRRCGIKDYGKILPGHGGMLDRFDSAFFTLPVGLLLALAAVHFF